ncbi:MAG: sarcosine oxidase subunit alpha family protein [Alphaproteobacteria bacterium]|nr:sarcosine oxidase subunit alpha family protein [Alphaproteobacteria bacterium]
MSQLFRMAPGGAWAGLIDRSREIRFSFDGRTLRGHPGDTLASALLANGVRLVGRSFKYHRPRGIVGVGAEEPNALIQLRRGERTEPNVRATQIELHDGLEAESQNRWPSLGFDLGAVNSALSGLFPAGFYYKTFMWPASWWMFYETFIRRVAGMGKTATAADPDHYEHMHVHCDVLVVGGGPAGLMAARAAGRWGARVIVCDEGAALGGSVLGERLFIDGKPAPDWVRETEAELAAMPEVRLLARTTAFGYYDQNMVTLVERVADHVLMPGHHQPRQRLWLVRARRVVLATGAIERPIVFADNDRPGVMLASAARAYANRYAVIPGKRVVLFTCNDGAYATALDLADAGVDVAGIVDTRPDPTGPLPARARAAGLAIHAGHAVALAHGGKALSGVEIMALDGDRLTGSSRPLHCDVLAVSGGWNPAVHLFSQAQGKLRFDDILGSFVPDRAAQAVHVAGSAAGHFALGQCLAEGARAGADAARLAGFGDGTPPATPATSEDAPAPHRTLWAIPPIEPGKGKRFVDVQNDVTAEDVALAAREGYRSVEHLKRYTTLGMGTDQGKTSNITGLAILSGIVGEPIPKVGTTTFRAPYTPVTFGTLVGPEVGEHLDPIRHSAMHPWHVKAGAQFVNAGLWKRAQLYRRPGETEQQAIDREVLNTREKVGIVDVSTLGKIDIQGPDAVEFLNRVYTNAWSKLEIGRGRYGIMLREDGMVFDDGTTTRLGPNHFLMTTTTANAVRVMAWLEYWLQVQWPDLKVYVASVTEQWAAAALAGPLARLVLADAVEGLDVSNEALPFMGYATAHIAGIPVRVFRISFSGELGFEVNVAADHGMTVWEALMKAGEKHGIMPYGTEALGVLRIEKGHFVVGPEADGRTTADDLGLSGLVSKTKDFIGKRSLTRPALLAPDRLQLVGLMPLDKKDEIVRGCQLVADGPGSGRGARPPVPMEGVVTSNCYSATLGCWIALALVKAGRKRHGETLHAQSPLTGRSVPVKIVPNVFIDPEGARLRV